MKNGDCVQLCLADLLLIYVSIPFIALSGNGQITFLSRCAYYWFALFLSFWNICCYISVSLYNSLLKGGFGFPNETHFEKKVFTFYSFFISNMLTHIPVTHAFLIRIKCMTCQLLWMDILKGTLSYQVLNYKL